MTGDEEEKKAEGEQKAELELVSDTLERVRRIGEMAGQVIRETRRAEDFLVPLQAGVEQGPANNRLPATLIGSLGALNVVSANLQTSFGVTLPAFISAARIAHSTSSDTLIAYSRNPTTQLASVMYRRNLERDSRYSEVVDLMRDLGLDRAQEGRRPPTDLLEEAKESLDQPVLRGGGAVGVGLALRGCIDDTLAFLLRHRGAGQEKVGRAPREKLVSIGRHLGHLSADPENLGHLAEEHEALLNVELDATKQADLSREQLGDLFHRGLLFLHALLSAIDKGQLKP